MRQAAVKQRGRRADRGARALVVARRAPSAVSDAESHRPEQISLVYGIWFCANQIPESMRLMVLLVCSSQVETRLLAFVEMRLSRRPAVGQTRWRRQ